MSRNRSSHDLIYLQSGSTLFLDLFIFSEYWKRWYLEKSFSRDAGCDRKKISEFVIKYGSSTSPNPLATEKKIKQY